LQLPNISAFNFADGDKYFADFCEENLLAGLLENKSPCIVYEADLCSDERNANAKKQSCFLLQDNIGACVEAP